MEFELTRDHQAFAQRVGAFLAGRVECNVIATTLLNLRGWGPQIDVLCAVGAEPDTGEIAMAAIRTPPWNMVVSGAIGSAQAQELMSVWLAEDPGLSGVSGEPAAARAIAVAWAQQTGGTVTRRHQEGMHVLTEVTPPARPVNGRLRQAGPEDRAILVGWDAAFSVEAREGGAQDAPVRVDRRLAAGHHYVWDDDGPVSMLARTPAAAGIVRIGPVYTPPALRNRGYATAAVAALSQLLLETAADRCMLFTDLSNPVSNRIYASIGYRRVGDWELYDFH